MARPALIFLNMVLGFLSDYKGKYIDLLDKRILIENRRYLRRGYPMQMHSLVLQQEKEGLN